MINIKSYPLSLTILLLQLLLATLIAAEARCWDPAASASTFGKLIFSDCKHAIDRITQTRDPSTRRPFDPFLPLLFSRHRSERPDIKIPKTWSDHVSSGDCVVGVDIPEALGGADKTSLDDIREAAMAVAVQCVMQREHLGGAITLGWQEKIVLVIRSLSDPSVFRVGTNHFNGTLTEA
ncbi:MAG: hypothetical protein Q9186_002079 [Xanthomendoza sp. 1 TL-2023]